MRFLKLLEKGLSLSSGNSQAFKKAKDIFTGSGSFDFSDAFNKDWNAYQKASKPIKVNIYKVEKAANFSQMFNDLKFNLEKLCLSPPQIIEFIQKYWRYLPRGLTTFFLFKSCNRYWVAGAYVCTNGDILMTFYKFKSGYVWSAGYHIHLVVPMET